MTDSHIHIGQYNEVYYEPSEILETVMESGMEGLAFSSTTTCRELVDYHEVETEIDRLLGQIRYSPETVQPYFWYIPAYIRQGITIEKAVKNLPYKGIKLHPWAQQWNFDDSQHITALHEIFGYAQDNSMPILLHTGEDITDTIDLFCKFAEDYSDIKIILAHSRPLENTLRLLRNSRNIYCDTAFVPKESVRKIIAAGFRERIIMGSDFPITHYYSNHYPKTGASLTTLKEQYKIDFSEMNGFDNLIHFVKINYKI